MDKELDYVLKQLEKRRGQLVQVAEGSGVSRRTLDYLLGGRDIKLSTLTALHAFLKSVQRRKKL